MKKLQAWFQEEGAKINVRYQVGKEASNKIKKGNKGTQKKRNSNDKLPAIFFICLNDKIKRMKEYKRSEKRDTASTAYMNDGQRMTMTCTYDGLRVNFFAGRFTRQSDRYYNRTGTSTSPLETEERRV